MIFGLLIHQRRGDRAVGSGGFFVQHSHLHINRFKASCVSREQDLQANSLRLKLQRRKVH
jgi:hypothetical protein